MSATGTSYAQMNIKLTKALTKGQTVNLRISSGNADFNSAGTGFNKYALVLLPTASTAVPDASVKTTLGSVVATVSDSGVVTNNLGLTVTQNVVAGSWVRLVEWKDDGGGTAANVNNNLNDEFESLTEGVGIYVHDSQNASCTAQPVVQITFSSSGGESTAKPINFAYITPQYSIDHSLTLGNSLDAELDTDNDFKTIVGGVRALNIANLFKIVDNSPIGLDAGSQISMWILYASKAPSGTIQFNVVSEAVQPGTSLTSQGTACSVLNNIFTCKPTTTNILAAHDLAVTLDGVNENNPTLWSMSNFSLTLDATSTADIGVSAICDSVTDSNLGSWYGGIEAIVPFVKYSPAAGYETYIKLFNRYGKPAKLYIIDLNNDSAKVVSKNKRLATVTSTWTDDAIPTGKYVEITGAKLKTIGYTDAQLANGTPVKFLIRVPAQMSNSNGTAYTTAAGANDVAKYSPYDPYINGIVVSIYGNNSQRSIPLTFKSYKQGQYN